MKTLILIMTLWTTSWASAVIYDDFEIQQLHKKQSNNQAAADLINNYFTNKNPDQVVNHLLDVDLEPLQREFLLNRLLTEVSQQPPQPFFQNFVDLMKQYQVKAFQEPEEGHSPVAIFNLNSKAHGIENIWTAYRTEQQFNQLFNHRIEQGLQAAKKLTESTNRPAWLGLQNSILSLSDSQKQQLADQLLELKNPKLDRLCSFVGLHLAHQPLLQQAIQSKQTSVREHTLRKLTSHVDQTIAKDMILAAAKNGLDTKISTTLLAQFGDDKNVQQFLLEQLSSKDQAVQAAFALGQIDDRELHEKMRYKYLKSNNPSTQNHILLALKLNRSESADVVLRDLQAQLDKSSTTKQWLQSFEGGSRE